MNKADRVVSIPMFNLLCVQQRLKLAASPLSLDPEEVRTQISICLNLVAEAIVELDNLGQGEWGEL